LYGTLIGNLKLDTTTCILSQLLIWAWNIWIEEWRKRSPTERFFYRSNFNSKSSWFVYSAVLSVSSRIQLAN